MKFLLFSDFILFTTSFYLFGWGYNVSMIFFSRGSSTWSFFSGEISSSIISCIAFLAFALDAGNSTSSSELEQPSSESASSSPLYFI